VDGEKLAKIIPNLGLPGAIFKKFLLHKNIHSNKDYES
jgi:hypothetical protein